MSRSLSALLLGHLGDRRHDAAAVEARLAAALVDAGQRWPEVQVAPERFAAWLAARIAADAPTVEHGLDDLRLADLYLACGCAAGDPAALAAFDAAFLAGDVRTSDDVKQALRQKLFVAEAGAPPRIASYAGRGALGRWVRAVATRLSLDEARRAREVPTEDALLDALGIDGAAGPELIQLKRDARRVVQTALREAIEALSARERTLLLQYYIDGLGLVALGKLFGLAPSNISRSLARARAVLVAGMRRSLMRHHGLPGEELDRLVDLVRSQLSLTGGLRRP